MAPVRVATARLSTVIICAVRIALSFTWIGSALGEIGPKRPKDNAGVSQTSAQDGKSCSEPKAGLANLPIERIEDVVKPTDAQDDGLKELENATAKAVTIMQAACPEDTPITPPGRPEAMEKRLQAMNDAANTVKPALIDFYGSLSSETTSKIGAMDTQSRTLRN